MITSCNKSLHSLLEELNGIYNKHMEDEMSSSVPKILNLCTRPDHIFPIRAGTRLNCIVFADLVCFIQ